jgi:uncharacterized OB-fold protein
MEKKREYIADYIVKEKPDGQIVLTGSVCAVCGHHAYPAVSFCPVCLSTDQKEYELGDEGTLYSFTVTRVPVAQYPVPHPIGYIQIPQSEARVTAPLFIEDEPYYKVGARVRMEIAEYWEDDEKVVVGPKYRIVREDSP